MYTHDFKEQLRKHLSFLNFEDVNYLINAFSIEYGYVEEADFRNVMFNLKEQLITRKLTSVSFISYSMMIKYKQCLL